MGSTIKRTRDVNFGDRTALRGGEQTQVLANIAVTEAQTFTVYVVAVLEQVSTPAVPLVTIEWGHGGASILSRDLVVYRRLRVPVVASTVKVTGRLVDAQGKAAPDTAKCHLSAFIAPGADGETLRSTKWIAQRGAEGLVSSDAEQLLTVEGYAAAPAARWVMLFDDVQRPADGAFPRIAAAARRTFRRERFDGHGFRYGVYWAASSTPITLTFDPTADLRMDVEVLA